MGTADQMVAIHRKAMENQKKALIDKATQWLFENVYDYTNSEDQERVAEFRKAMGDLV